MKTLRIIPIFMLLVLLYFVRTVNGDEPTPCYHHVIVDCGCCEPTTIHVWVIAGGNTIADGYCDSQSTFSWISVYTTFDEIGHKCLNGKCEDDHFNVFIDCGQTVQFAPTCP